MKNVFKFLGIIALAAVFWFPMVSCGDDGFVDVMGGVLELTNLGAYKGQYIVAWGNNDTLVALNVNKQNGERVSENGTAFLSVWNIEGEGTPSFTAYKGSDTMVVRVIISDDPSVNFDDGSDVGEGGWAIAKFTNGGALGVFTDKLSGIVSNLPDLKNGILTLTGLEEYNDKYVAAFGKNDNDTLQLVVAKNVNIQTGTGKGVKIKNGKAVLNVWEAKGDDQSSYTVNPYKGYDTVNFSVSIYDTANVKFREEPEDGKGGKALATFQKGIGAGYFYIFDYTPPENPPVGGTTSVDITVPNDLLGTWTGEGGALVFANSSISTTDGITSKSYTFIAAIKRANTGTVTIKSNGTNGTITKLVDNFASVNLYSWTIVDSTLTITDNLYGTTAFTGTKQ